MSDTQARLDAYKAAELAVLKGQSYRYGERMLTMADLSEIRKAIVQLRAELAAETGAPPSRGSLRYKTVIF